MSTAAAPLWNPDIARGYERWYTGPGRAAEAQERRLLGRLIRDFEGARSVLDIGCGTGHFTRWIRGLGLETTGIDSSEPMLREARARDGGIAYEQGDAIALPMEPRAFDLALMVTSLEFMGDPLRALGEAVRVARRGLVLGVLNRSSVLALRRRLTGGPLVRSARLFSPRELVTLVRRAAGERLVAVRWLTTLWPCPGVGELPLPWGGFIGLAAVLAAGPPNAGS